MALQEQEQGKDDKGSNSHSDDNRLYRCLSQVLNLLLKSGKGFPVRLSTLVKAIPEGIWGREEAEEIFRAEGVLEVTVPGGMEGAGERADVTFGDFTRVKEEGGQGEMKDKSQSQSQSHLHSQLPQMTIFKIQQLVMTFRSDAEVSFVGGLSKAAEKRRVKALTKHRKSIHTETGGIANQGRQSSQNGPAAIPQGNQRQVPKPLPPPPSIPSEYPSLPKDLHDLLYDRLHKPYSHHTGGRLPVPLLAYSGSSPSRSARLISPLDADNLLACVPPYLQGTSVFTIPKIRSLYLHQYKAISSILEGEHTVISTSTGSGKTLSYLFPLFMSGRKALLIYPTKALASDQLGKVRGMAPEGCQAFALTGDTPFAERSKILSEAKLILTNVDTLNAYFLPALSSRNPANEFIRDVGYCVLDEGHYYTGSFLLNTRYTLARLRLATGALVFVSSSATVDNPERLIRSLCPIEGEAVAVVDDDASPGGAKHFYVCQTPLIKGPPDSLRVHPADFAAS